MTAEEQGQCLQAFRRRIGLENLSEAARELAKAQKKEENQEESVRRAIYRYEEGDVKPRPKVLAAWSAVATRRGFHRRTGKRTKVLLKEIYRIDTAKEWMSLLEELVHDSDLPRELPIAKGFGGPGDRRLPSGAILPNESHVETIHLDEYVTHVRCSGPQQFWIITKPRPMEKTIAADVRDAMEGFSLTDLDAIRDRTRRGESLEAAIEAIAGRKVDFSSKTEMVCDNQVVSTFWLAKGEAKELFLDSEFLVMEGCSLTDNVRSRKIEEYQRGLHAKKA